MLAADCGSMAIWRGPSIEPTGVLLLMALSELAMSARVRSCAASLSGSALTRTAKRFCPLTLTCATPVSVESVGEMMSSP